MGVVRVETIPQKTTSLLIKIYNNLKNYSFRFFHSALHATRQCWMCFNTIDRLGDRVECVIQYGRPKACFLAFYIPHHMRWIKFKIRLGCVQGTIWGFFPVVELPNFRKFWIGEIPKKLKTPGVEILKQLKSLGGEKIL